MILQKDKDHPDHRSDKIFTFVFMKKPTIVRNRDLKPLNTFGIAARAAGYAEFESKDDLDAIFTDPAWKGKPWTVIGGGSNILPLGDYGGLVLHPSAGHIVEIGRQGDAARVRVGAGMEWDTLVAWSVDRGYGGLENLSGIPGTVGASPVQNIGAYGAEVKDSLSAVEFYDAQTGEVRRLTGDECRFGYRESVFKHEWKGRAIVLAVEFRLALKPAFSLGYGDLSREVEALGGPSLENIRTAVLAIRAAKLPDPKVLGNSGSFFKNPVVPAALAEVLRAEYPEMPVYPAAEGVKLAAGWMIDRAGLKGFRQGDAGVHEKQALVLVNYGGASGTDMLALSDHVIDTVRRTFGVTIEREVNLL
jgi:UDP-N-acetylmuramate dehydrogenase